METTSLWADPLNLVNNPQYFNPPRYVRTGPGNANDGGLKFDLTKINPDFLERLHYRATQCAQRGIYAIVQLFQGWQIERKGGTDNPSTAHPYLSANNINSVNGDANADGDLTETHTDTNNNAWSYQQTLVTTIVTLLNHLPNIIYEISNEDTGSTANTNWQEDLISHIRTVEASLPHQHLIMRTVCYPSGDNTALDASAAELVSYNSGKADDVLTGTRVALRDSDHVEGLTDTYAWIWTALCNGSGGALYMDEWEGGAYGTDRRNNATYQLIRSNLGYALTIARRPEDLLAMTPQAALCSTGYCLARNHATNADYICFQPGSGSFTLNLSTATGTLNIYWLRCSTGATSTDTVAGGATRTLTPPWTGVVAAHVYH
jgi:hypothetical protein